MKSTLAILALVAFVAAQAPYGVFLNTNYEENDGYLNYMCVSDNDPEAYTIGFWDAGIEYGTVVGGVLEGFWLEVGYNAEDPTFLFGSELGTCNSTYCSATYGRNEDTADKGEWAMAQISDVEPSPSQCWSFDDPLDGTLDGMSYEYGNGGGLSFTINYCFNYGVGGPTTSEYGNVLGGTLIFNDETYMIQGLCPTLLMPEVLCQFNIQDDDGTIVGVGASFNGDLTHATVWMTGDTYDIDAIADPTLHLAFAESVSFSNDPSFCSDLYPIEETTSSAAGVSASIVVVGAVAALAF